MSNIEKGIIIAFFYCLLTLPLLLKLLHPHGQQLKASLFELVSANHWIPFLALVAQLSGKPSPTAQ